MANMSKILASKILASLLQLASWLQISSWFFVAAHLQQIRRYFAAMFAAMEVASTRQSQCIQRQELLQNRILASFHLRHRSEETRGSLVQKNHAVG